MKKKRKAAAGSAAVPEAKEEPGGAEHSEEVQTKQRSKTGAARAAKRDSKQATKQPRDKQFDHDDEQGEDAEEETGDDVDGDDLDVEFEFVDPDEEDFYTVSSLLKAGMWDFVELNFSELADSIVGQGNIGTLVKSSADIEETTICGMLTALNLRQFSQLSWPTDVTNSLVEKAKKFADPAAASRFEAIMKRTDPTAKEVGFIFSERYVNIPPQLIPPLHQALRDDIEWSCSTPECPPEERPFYHFDHFVGMTRCVSGASGGSSEGGRKKRRKANEAAETVASNSATVYPQAEYEVYMRRAMVSFTFPFTSEKRQHGATKHRGQERRAVFVITRKALEQVIAELKQQFVSSQGL